MVTPASVFFFTLRTRHDFTRRNSTGCLGSRGNLCQTSRHRHKTVHNTLTFSISTSYLHHRHHITLKSALRCS